MGWKVVILRKKVKTLDLEPQWQRGGSQAKSSVRSAMLIARHADGRPSSVGAACVYVGPVFLESCASRGFRPCRSYGAWVMLGGDFDYKHDAPTGASRSVAEDPCKMQAPPRPAPLETSGAEYVFLRLTDAESLPCVHHARSAWNYLCVCPPVAARAVAVTAARTEVG